MKMHLNQSLLLSISFRLAIILLLLAYLPMFFGKAVDLWFGIRFEELKSIYESSYSILTCFGIGFLLITKEKSYLVPIIAMFFVMGTIFFINTLFDSFYNTFYPVLLIIISMLLCSFLFIYYRHKYSSLK